MKLYETGGYEGVCFMVVHEICQSAILLQCTFYIEVKLYLSKSLSRATWGCFVFFLSFIIFFPDRHYIRPYLPPPALGCQWQLALICTPPLDKKHWQALSSQFLRHVARHKLICHSLLTLTWGWHTTMHANTHSVTKTNGPSIKSRYTNWDTIARQKWKKPLEKLTVFSFELHQSHILTERMEDLRTSDFPSALAQPRFSVLNL